jgi:hypothetical protein
MAVLAATVASMVLGFLWYGPIFGKQWMALMGFTQASMEEAKKKGMAKSYAAMAIGSLVMFYVLAHSLEFASAYTGATGAEAGCMVAFWSWLGFVAPVTMGSVLWEGKSWKLWILNNSYWLLNLIIGGVILARWQM